MSQTGRLLSLPISSFSAAPHLRRDAGHWRPGLGPAVSGARHSEIFGAGDEAAAAAVALAFAQDRLRAAGSPSGDPRMILWVQDRAARKLAGRPYRPGLPAPLRDRLTTSTS